MTKYLWKTYSAGFGKSREKLYAQKNMNYISPGLHTLGGNNLINSSYADLELAYIILL